MAAIFISSSSINQGQVTHQITSSSSEITSLSPSLWRHRGRGNKNAKSNYFDKRYLFRSVNIMLRMRWFPMHHRDRSVSLCCWSYRSCPSQSHVLDGWNPPKWFYRTHFFNNCDLSSSFSPGNQKKCRLQ